VTLEPAVFAQLHPAGAMQFIEFPGAFPCERSARLEGLRFDGASKKCMRS
jgi:hypothetical protein